MAINHFYIDEEDAKESLSMNYDILNFPFKFWKMTLLILSCYYLVKTINRNPTNVIKSLGVKNITTLGENLQSERD